MLVALQCDDVQITIDGPEQIHDKRRILRNGAGTFRKIIDNLVYITKKFKTIRIRVNIDDENVAHIDELLIALEPYKDRIFIGFMPVQKTEKYTNTCYNVEQYSDLNHRIYEKATEQGFKIIRGFGLTGSIYCGAYQLKNIVIDPTGKLFGCIVDLGHADRSIGEIDVNGHIHYDYPKMIGWNAWEPFDDPKCLECEVLPVCMGGCLKYIKNPSQDRCLIKHTIKERIRFAFHTSDNEK